MKWRYLPSAGTQWRLPRQPQDRLGALLVGEEGGLALDNLLEGVVLRGFGEDSLEFLFCQRAQGHLP